MEIEKFIEAERIRKITGILLRDVCRSLIAKIKYICEERRTSQIMEQINNVLIPQQALLGSENDFGFGAYPLPMLTKETAMQIDLSDFIDHSFDIDDFEVVITLDDFARINYFKIRGFPDLFHKIKAGLLNTKTYENFSA